EPALDRPGRPARPGGRLRRRRRPARAAHEPLPPQGPAPRRDAPGGELVTMAEYDSPKNSMILAMVIGTVISLVVVVLGIAQFFDMSVRDEIESKVLSQPSSALRDLRASEQAHLSRYAWVDQKAGIVRLPLDRAVELTLRDWEKRPA